MVLGAERMTMTMKRGERSRISAIVKKVADVVEFVVNVEKYIGALGTMANNVAALNMLAKQHDDDIVVLKTAVNLVECRREIASERKMVN